LTFVLPMKILKNIISFLFGRKIRHLSSKNAYNKLAATYDQASKHVIRVLDDLCVQTLLNKAQIQSKNSLDYGAGTGRNIELLNSLTSQKVYAYDISSEMLNILKDKHPEVTQIGYGKNNQLIIEHNSIDFILCNLCIGYIKHLDQLFNEWDRILTKKGFIILSDIHLQLLADGNRSFVLDDTTIIIEHFKHQDEKLQELFLKYHWEIVAYHEIKIDSEVKELFGSKMESYNVLKNKIATWGYLLRKINQTHN